jgi:hypothetical protein
MTVVDTLKRLEANWGEAQPAIHGGTPTFFKLRCAVTWGTATLPGGSSPPDDVASFWDSATGARLFVDEDYGQWGLVLFGPAEAAAATERFRAERPGEFREGDLIIGEFKGDSDFLLVRCDRSERDFGVVLVPTPLDPRSDWEIAAGNLCSFLDALERTQGEKFWE